MFPNGFKKGTPDTNIFQRVLGANPGDAVQGLGFQGLGFRFF